MWIILANTTILINASNEKLRKHNLAHHACTLNTECRPREHTVISVIGQTVYLLTSLVLQLHTDQVTLLGMEDSDQTPTHTSGHG